MLDSACTYLGMEKTFKIILSRQESTHAFNASILYTEFSADEAKR
jgi:hypothetical protein